LIHQPSRGLYAITPEAAIGPLRLAQMVEQAIAGGACMIQYRCKVTDALTRQAEAGALADVCRAAGVPLLINDEPALARLVGAHGVHLGRDDPTIAEARGMLGPSALIGATCHDSLELALAAARAGADYVAFGSFFPSPTKPGAVRAPLDLLPRARAALEITIAAIGGITPSNGTELIAAGADYLAVVSGIFNAGDPCEAARAYARLF
jgi:thiamine-phosphate pyrophosphorylase